MWDGFVSQQPPRIVAPLDIIFLEKSKNLIGYVPKISFEESITKVINNDKV